MGIGRPERGVTASGREAMIETFGVRSSGRPAMRCVAECAPLLFSVNPRETEHETKSKDTGDRVQYTGAVR